MSQPQQLAYELGVYFEPLITATGDAELVALFLNQFGYDLGSPGSNAAVQEFATTVAAMSDSLEGAIAAGDPPVDGVALAADLFTHMKDLAESDSVQDAVGDAAEFGLEVFDFLSYWYLARRTPPLVAVLKAMGVITVEPVLVTDPGGRDVDYERIEFQWSLLGDFVADNAAWAKEVYGWGEDFDHEKAIDALIHVVEASGLVLAKKRDLTDGEVGAFLENSDGQDIAGATIPLWQDDLADVLPEGTPVFANEAGLKVLPVGDLDQPQQLGLAFTPYAQGMVSGSHPLTETLTLDVSVDASATGGASLSVRPGSLEVIEGGAVDAGFEFGLVYARPDGTPILLAGDPAATRIEADAILGSVGGNLDGDLFVAGGVKQLRMSIDVSGDGFLGAIISAPIEVDAGDVLLGWRPGRGVYFEGGTGIGVTVPLNIDLHVAKLTEAGLRLDWADDFDIIFLISGSATLGPLFASVEELGLIVTIVDAPEGNGALGKYDLAFGIRPPTGYAVALESTVLSGGGYLSVNGHEYRGALALQFQSFGISAFAILTTKLPDNRDGFSFVASIFGSFMLPLPYGFFLTGVGGIIGVNRTTDTDALRTVLFEGRFDNLLFPEDPISNAQTILDDMAAIFPAQEGQYLFGPIARLGWGQPILVEVTLGVVLEVGNHVKLLILGGLASQLPTKDAAIVDFKCAFFGEINIAAGTISFDATLQGSRILAWPVSGDAAIRTGWAPRIEHIASFGGLHPQFPRPSNLPELRRISINFGTNNPKVTLSGYAAVTLNSLQFGARADLYAKGPDIWLVGQVAAEGWIFFDALITFNPFGFDIGLGGGLQLLVDGKVKAGLGFELNLKGPNPFAISGKVWVTVFGIDVDFPITHTWGNRQSLPAATADPAQVLQHALAESRGFDPLPASDVMDAIVFADDSDVRAAINAAGGARLAQRALPLGVRIDKVGEAHLASGAGSTMDLKAFTVSGSPVSLTTARLDFVRGHFWNITEAEKLRAPVLEQHKAGFDVSTGGLVADTSKAISTTYDYEVIEIPFEDDRAKGATVLTHHALSDTFLKKWMRVNQKLVAEPVTGYSLAAPPDAVKIRESIYVTSDALHSATQSMPSSTPAFDAMHNTLDRQNITLTGSIEKAIDQAVGRDDFAINVVVADYIAAGGIGR